MKPSSPKPAMKPIRIPLPQPARALPGRPKDFAKRESIVRAATTLFFKEGYTLTSMDAVAKKADVSKLTIYSHFVNKGELFMEVLRQRCDARGMPSSFMEKANEPVEPALTQIATNLVTMLYDAESIRMHRMLYAEALNHNDVVRMFYEAAPKRVRGAFSELLREWCSQGQLAIPDIPRATEQFFSLLKGEMMARTLMMLIPPLSPRDAKKHAQATVAFFLAAYRPRSPKGVS